MQTIATTTPTATTDVLTLSRLERFRRAFAALSRLVANPDETDQVLEFTTNVNAGTLPARISKFYADPMGQRLYAERRAIDSRVDLDALAALPDGTLGHAYAQFLRSRGLTPDVFDGSPANIGDERVAYVVQRMRQTHDLWHVVTGHDTDPRGEIALQAFTYGQVGAPASLILAAVGTVKGTRGVRALPGEVLAAYRAGVRADRLTVFPWEDHWATSLDDVREMLNIVPVAHRARAAA
jgi:ubiquinone biosynthesis protein COQ4|nr:Coq4 family protein [Kofleriaceae bacterium]